MSLMRKKGSHFINFILINAVNDKCILWKKLETVNNDKNVREMIKYQNLLENYIRSFWQKCPRNHVSTI